MKTNARQGETIPDLAPFLELFAETFVEAGFRERFVHEAIKRPLRLSTKIRHSIEDVFSSRYLGQHAIFQPDDRCVAICGTEYNFQTCRWHDLATYINRGAGILIASADATRFYAETETEYKRPHLIYSGSKPKTKGA